ncbi:FGGY-family carbohydrate kinase [Nitratireductor sp. XY-223]|uniref:FGGY-family carbohydrate kinase n=1 Tax=Nitratireductor sp. XY-223 TaxID=2561926 RepID=UPI0010A9F0B9|nr:FGGY-family carbohydrate kinase [Nitratireductor sp. XY-223]
MTARRNTAVIDIGKTNAKIVLVDNHRWQELAVIKRQNATLSGPPYPHFDLSALWRFILDGLEEMQQSHGIDAIVVTTHGASAVLIDKSGDLAVPMLDYEHSGPDALAADYDAVRPPFSETGSPRLPLGLNVGAQLYWLFRTVDGLFEHTDRILTYPQYWAFRLTGIAATEPTSLGCHTDLWCPQKGGFSSLVETQGWLTKMAPVHSAGETLGPLLPEICRATGIAADVPVICGIHDSNASLVPHLHARKPPFSVVSSGTWVIVMSVGGRQVQLAPDRDTLINVNAFGEPVPSARFMGGREHELVLGGRAASCTDDDLQHVLDNGIMLLPAVENRSGPFQGRKSAWIGDEDDLTDGWRFAALSFYLAGMTAVCLEMVGARGETVVEGPFSKNRAYCTMLAAATRRDVVAVSGTGTSVGAAMLRDPGSQAGTGGIARYDPGDSSLNHYADKWLQETLHRV